MYSEDEEVACTNFTRDFYRLVSIKSESNRSLQSPTPVDTTASSSDENERLTSPTPSEAGQAQVHSCSSSESSDVITERHEPPLPSPPPSPQRHPANIHPAATTDLLQDVLITCHNQHKVQQNNNKILRDGTQTSSPTWRRSNGWRRVPRNNHVRATLFYLLQSQNVILKHFYQPSGNAHPCSNQFEGPFEISTTCARTETLR